MNSHILDTSHPPKARLHLTSYFSHLTSYFRPAARSLLTPNHFRTIHILVFAKYRSLQSELVDTPRI